MGWESFVVDGFDLNMPLLQGQTRIAKLKVLITRLLLIIDLEPLLQCQTRTAIFKSGYNSLIIDPRGLQCEANV